MRAGLLSIPLHPDVRMYYTASSSIPQLVFFPWQTLARIPMVTISLPDFVADTENVYRRFSVCKLTVWMPTIHEM